MFGKRLKNIEDVMEYLTGIVKERNKTLDIFDKQRAEDQLSKFMYWNGIEFMGECFSAALAQYLIDHINGAKEDGMSADSQYDSIESIAERRVMEMRIRIGVGSTNMAANLSNDFENKFYIELNQKLKGGY